jgi:hypothetical protein
MGMAKTSTSRRCAAWAAHKNAGTTSKHTRRSKKTTSHLERTDRWKTWKSA